MEENKYNINFDVLKDVQEGAFIKGIKEKSDNFSITFVFPKTKKEKINALIKQNGKQYYTNLILDLFK